MCKRKGAPETAPIGEVEMDSLVNPRPTSQEGGNVHRPRITVESIDGYIISLREGNGKPDVNNGI